MARKHACEDISPTPATNKLEANALVASLLTKMPRVARKSRSEENARLKIYKFRTQINAEEGIFGGQCEARWTPGSGGMKELSTSPTYRSTLVSQQQGFFAHGLPYTSATVCFGAAVRSVVVVLDALCLSAQVDFVDINMGCPIDLVCDKGMGAALMGRTRKLRGIIAVSVCVCVFVGGASASNENELGFFSKFLSRSTFTKICA